MRISELTEASGAAWDCYVSNAQAGLPHHLSGWRKVMACTYGYETIYLMAMRADESCRRDIEPHSGEVVPTESIVGVLPLYVIRSPLLGRTVTSMPGGLCADDDESALALLARAKEIMVEQRADRFVLHDSRQAWPDAELATSSGHEQWLIDVRTKSDDLWQGLDRNIRRQIRLARRNNLAVEIDRTGEQVDEFYALFSRFAHSAGTPVFPRAFLHHIVANFRDKFNIVRVCLDGKTIGAYFQLELGNINHGVWGATLHEYLDLRPVYLAYWTILEDSVERGFSFLDMGRSPTGSNASKYKGQWGGKAAPIFQQTFGLRGQVESMSMVDQTQSDAKFQLVRTLWPKLPYRVAQILGPQIRRHVPFA